MIVPGVASVTFRDKTPQEVIQLAAKAGLGGIEWGGDIHVPVGHLEQAASICRLTKDAGLTVSGYGSYYVMGKSGEEGMRFGDVLDTARALHAPVIRIWAGEKSSRESTPAYRKRALDETKERADEAGRYGIRLAFEFHDDTLNDGYEACCELLTELAHPQVSTLWQPLHGAGPAINGAGIDLIRSWIVGVHIFHWWPKAEMRLPLVEGEEDWRRYMDRLSGIPGNISGNLEFVKDDSPDQFLRDAATLLELF